MNRAVRVVFIDWGGTLSNTRFWGHWEKLKPERYSFIQQYLFGTNKEVVRSWMRGELSAEEISRTLGEAMSVSEHELLKELKSSCQQLKFIEPTVIQAIEKIRLKGTKVVIATDNMDTFSRWTVPALKLHEHFDDILISHSLSAIKNDAKIDGSSKFFSAYLNNNQLSPEETILFDDGASYIKDFGIKYVEVTKTKPLVSALKTYFNESF